MTPTVPDARGNALRTRFASLRRRLRLVTGLRGVSWLLVVVLSTIALVGAADWYWHLPSLVRAVLLVCGLVGAGVILYRYLLVPLQERLDNLSLALRVEDNYPSLNDSLASTVEFLEHGMTREGNSPSLQAEAVRRALKNADDCDFERVVDSRGLRSGVLSGLAVCAIAIALGVMFPAQAQLALVRLLDPFGTQTWPTKTQLAIAPPRAIIGENEPFILEGTVTGIVPEHASLVLRVRGKGEKKYPEYPIEKIDEKTGSLHIRLEPDQIRGSFRAQVRANDAVSEWFDVRVLPAPSLVLLNGNPSPQVELHYPAYTELPSPNVLSPGSGNIPESVYGTRVVLKGAADRPLGRAWIEYIPATEGMRHSLALTPLGASNVLDTMTLLAGSMRVLAPVEATLQANPAHFRIEFHPCVEGAYSLHLEDRLEPHPLRREREYELRMRNDPVPVVHLLRPSATRDLMIATPAAELPLEFTVSDPIYAVRSAKLRYRTRRGNEALAEIPPWREESFYDPEAGRDAVLPWTGVGVLASDTQLQPTYLRFERVLFLRDLRHPDGSPLADGDEVVLQVCSDDFDNITFGKQPGCSHEVRILVVGRQGFEDELSAQQKQLRNELLELQKKEQEAIDLVEQAEIRLEQDEALTEEEYADLLQGEQLQKEIQGAIGNEEGGLRAKLERLRESLRQNQLEESLTGDRLEDLLAETTDLAQNELPEIAARLVDAVEQAEQLGTQNREDAPDISAKRELETKAKQLEEQAKAARLTEETEKKEVARAEQLAEETKSPEVKKQLTEEAQRHRRLADEARRKAEQLEQEAAELNKQAAQIPEPAQAEKTLEAVRQMQEDVESRLEEMLGRLEPWSSTQEIKGEAKQLLQQQQDLQERAKRLEQEGTSGRKPEELTPQEKADLRKLEEAQEKLEKRAERLLDQMKRMSEDLEPKDPETAKDLRDSRAEAMESGIVGQMKEARQQIAENQLGNAQTSQRESIRSLENLLDKLDSRGAKEQERLIKKQKEIERALERLQEDQDLLQKKIEATKKLPEGERADALKQLQGDQARLNKRANELRNELENDLRRLRAERAAEQLDDALAQMENQLERLEKGEEPEENEDDILDRLDQAQQQLERARELAEEQLEREQLERVAKVLAQIRDRQKSLLDESKRIQDRVRELEKWTRGLQLGSLDKLINAQELLAKETKQIGEKDLQQAPVIALMMKRISEAMTDAVGRFRTMYNDLPAPEKLPDLEALRLQELAHRRLVQILQAIQEELDKPQLSQNGNQGGGQGGQGGGNDPAGGGGGTPGDSIPPLAQLKLLRLLELEVREGLRELQKEHPELENLDEAGKKRLESLLQQRQDIRELFDELNRDSGEAPAAEGEE